MKETPEMERDLRKSGVMETREERRGRSGPQGRGVREGTTDQHGGRGIRRWVKRERECECRHPLLGAGMGEIGREDSGGGGRKVQGRVPGLPSPGQSLVQGLRWARGGMLLLPGKGGHEGWEQMSVCLSY